MKYNYAEEYVKLLLENVGNLILLPQYMTNADYKTSTQLFNAMNSLSFQMQTEKELLGYIKMVDKLKPLTENDKKAIHVAREDLYYLLRLKG